MLRNKGVHPSVPMPPSLTQPRPNLPPAVPAFTQQVASEAAPVRQPKARARPQPQPREQIPQVSAEQEGLKGFYKYAAEALEHRRSPQAIRKYFIDQGVSPQTTEMILEDALKAFRKTRAKKYRSQVLVGLLMTVAGAGVTAIGYTYADLLGGYYLICSGAIALGILYMLGGFVGWMANLR
jgi:hypothetical protein